MEASACPVCTLYLREGMSLYDHLDTHPKEHVIEALVRFHEDTQGISLPTSQAITSTTFYHPQAQVLPIQQYSSNAYSYQPVLANNMSPNPPVTMLLPQNASNTNIPMMYNPFVMQQAQAPQVHSVNSPNSGLIQQTQTSIQRTICATSSLNVDSRHFMHSGSTLPVHISTTSDLFEKLPARTLPNTLTKSVITTLPHPSLTKPLTYSRLRTPGDNVTESFFPVSAVASQSGIKTPIVRMQSNEGSLVNPALKRNTNVRIVHIFPKPPQIDNTYVPNSNFHISHVPEREPGQAVNPEEPNSGINESYVTNNSARLDGCFSQNLCSEMCGIMSNSNIVVTPLPLRFNALEQSSEMRSNSTPTVLPIPKSETPISQADHNSFSPIPRHSPSFHARPRSTPAISLSINTQPTESIPSKTIIFPTTFADSALLPKSEEIIDASIQSTTFNKNLTKTANLNNIDEPVYTPLHSMLPEQEETILPSLITKSLPTNQRNTYVSGPSKRRNSSISIEKPAKRTGRSRSDCLDIELNSIDLTELGDREYFVGQSTSSHFQAGNGSQEMLLNYSEDSNDVLITSPVYHKIMSPRLQTDHISPEDSKDNVLLINTEDCSMPPECNSKPHPSSRPTSRGPSPGLRIRTDLGSKLPEYLNKSGEFIQSFLDCSNEATDLVDLERETGLRIQLPPVPATESEEYITADCFDPMDNNGLSRLKTSIELKKCDAVYESTTPLKESMPFDPKNPINIVEIDGVHIMVPRQFYIMPDNLAKPSKQESSTGAEVALSEGAIMPVIKQIDDTHVSTSYDLLARESWITSDGSDTELNADCNATSTWEDVIESRSTVERRFSKGRMPRVYKCAVCGETFDCPKERRVHRSNHHANKDKVIPSELQPLTAEVTAEQPQLAPAISKKLKKKCPAKKFKRKNNILLVKEESADFLGVFVQEDKVTQIDGIPGLCNDQLSGLPASSDVKPESIASIDAKPRWKCNTCSEVFVTKKILLGHLRTNHRPSPIEGNFMCDVCQEIYPSELVYNIHLKVHPLECKTCGKNFFRQQNMLLHMKRHLGIKPHKCNLCSKAFVTKQKLNEHKNVHTGAAPIKCPLCPMSFRRYSNLIQHKNRLHFKLKKKIKDYVCHCGDIFHSRKKLYWHKEVHDGRPKYCMFCSERFIHLASLTRHIRRAHDHKYLPKVGREAENVECSICGHMFLKSSIVTHMRLHTGERPFSCTVCGKNFTTKWNLQMHRWTHMSRSNKPFKCSLCKSAFSRESDYVQHMDAHRNKRQYTCNICGEQFVRKNNCQRHVREHEAAKTFTCKECGKQFHRGYYLKDHMRVHTGARPYVCHICNKSSSTKSNHNKHVKIHHAREPVNTES